VIEKLPPDAAWKRLTKKEFNARFRGFSSSARWSVCTAYVTCPNGCAGRSEVYFADGEAAFRIVTANNRSRGWVYGLKGSA
jgi:hypothetical protein